MNIIISLACQAFLATLLYHGLVGGDAMAMRVFAGAQLIVGIILSVGWSSKMMEAVRLETNPEAMRHKHITRFISFACHGLFIVAVAWYGYYLLAAWMVYTLMAAGNVAHEMDRDL